MIERYAIGDRTARLVHDADGGLTLTLAHMPPQDAKARAESQDFVSDVACQRVPALLSRQLRRSAWNMQGTRSDIGNHGLDLVAGFVGERAHVTALAVNSLASPHFRHPTESLGTQSD